MRDEARAEAGDGHGDGVGDPPLLLIRNARDEKKHDDHRRVPSTAEAIQDSHD
jgi:hypothetical protein